MKLTYQVADSFSDSLGAVDSYVFFCHQGETELVYSLLHGLCEVACAQIEREKFDGTVGEVVVIPFLHKGAVCYGVVVGLGARIEAHASPMVVAGYVERVRDAVGSVVRTIESLKISSCAVDVGHICLDVVGARRIGYEIVLTWVLAAYQFTTFVTDSAKHKPRDYAWTFILPSQYQSLFVPGCADGEVVGRAANSARDWCDSPPAHMTPQILAQKAEEVASAHGMKCTMFSEDRINQEGMGGIAGVSRGSDEKAWFVLLEYGQSFEGSTVGLVGKGVTFDSGGLSLKTAESMETQKDDMAGAAVVIATMHAIAQLKLPIHVVAAVPLVENVPSGKSFKPGDIIRFYNGKTAEIRNTDAEGRLILADALAYITRHYKIDYLYDIATLTGACILALGPLYAAVMGRHGEELDQLVRIGFLSGDLVWRMPFDERYKKSISSDVADISNSGTIRYRAGAITAGLFLSYFVDPGVRWVHIDIAGVAFGVPDRSYYRSGATGFGVRLFVDLMRDFITHETERMRS